MDSFNTGDRVGWNTPQGMHTGTVLERREDDFMLPRQRMTASTEKPVYVVQADTTGERAAHPPETLQRLSS